jgi:hypothetical protein
VVVLYIKTICREGEVMSKSGRTRSVTKQAKEEPFFNDKLPEVGRKLGVALFLLTAFSLLQCFIKFFVFPIVGL